MSIEEELRTVAAVEVGPAAGEVPADGLGSLPADRDDPLLVALAHAAHEAIVERDPSLFEGDGFRNAEAGAVQQLDERAVA